jgi:uncharacterized protein (DUF1499 family)
MNGLFGRLALLAAIAAAILVAVAGPAYKYELADVPTAFSFMRYGVYAAGVAGVLAVLWIVFALIGRSANGLTAFLAAIVIAGAAAAGPILLMQKAGTVPPIHDITTDTANPPAFVALKDARAQAPNGVDYKAEDNVEAQQKAYPDIQPLIAPDVAPADMFKRAEATARAMNWHIAAAETEEGRIEATDTTAWFGFKDDIVIRITAEGAGSRVDVRSMSRVGKSDIGKNAERIREFMTKLKEAK